MIRFSAVLVVVAVGVLIGGIATSALTLVYVAIVLSAVALILLGIGVALKRSEIFGDTSQQVGAYTGVAASQSALAAQHLAGDPAAGNTQPRYGTGWTPPRGAGSAGGVAETRTDLAALSPDPSKSGSRAGGGGPDETRLDLPATRPAPAPQAPAPPPPGRTPASAPPPPDATSVDLPRIEAEPLPPLTPKADAPAESETPPPASQAAPTAAQPVIGSSQVAPTTIQPAIKLDETSLDLMNTGQSASGTPASASDASAGGSTGGSGAGSSSGTSGSVGAPGSPAASSDRQVAVVPGVPRYHAINCILIRFMDEADLEKMTAAAADAAGYTPCGACQADTGSFKVAD